MVEVLMRLAHIVEIEVTRKRRCPFPLRRVGVQVDVFVLDAASQPFDEHIVDPTALTVHADANILGSQNPGECKQNFLTRWTG
jgi:hypothetical protein